MSTIDIKEILSQLTLDEKIGQLVQLPGEFFKDDASTTITGPSAKLGLNKSYEVYNTGSILNVVNPVLIKEIQEKYLANSRHKIPLLFMADIIYGYKTILPIPIAQACSFDFEMIKKGAEVIANEAYNDGHHITFSPMLDIVRDLRWGRVMESFGEDVYVGKQYAQAMVEGFQGNDINEGHIAACLKHFAAYGAAVDGRDYGAVDMSLQQFYEVQLPAYKAAIEAKCKLVMTSFNTINGVPATGNKWLNRKVLREELNFNGVLITDYAAIKELVDHGVAEDTYHAAKLALESGVDIDMKTAVYANEIKSLVENKAVDISLVDEAVLRVLELKKELGLFENPYRGLINPVVKFSEDMKKEIALNLSSKTSVLLKNNGILPLKKNQKIALIGPHGKQKGQFGMWAFTGDRELSVDLKTALEEEFDSVSYAEGSNILLDYSRLGFSANGGNFMDMFPVKNQQELEAEAIDLAKQSDVIVLAVGENMMESGEGASKTNPTLSEPQKQLIYKLKKLNKPIIGVIYAGRPLILSDIESYFDGLLYAWYPGTYGNISNAQILSGKINPSGKLSMTFPKSVGQVPIHYSTYRSGRPILAEDVAYRFTSRYLDETNAPLYPFGFGLSYTTFDIGEIKTTRKEFGSSSLPIVSAVVKNTGTTFGEEVVQLYIKDLVASISRPVIELKATKRIKLQPQEETVVEFQLTQEDLSYHDQLGNLVLESGEFLVSITNVSSNISNHDIIKLV